MKVDFRNVEIELIDGSTTTRDLSKELANAIYRTTPDLGELDFAMTLYKEGEVEIDEEKKALILKTSEQIFLAFVKKALIKLLSEDT